MRTLALVLMIVGCAAAYGWQVAPQEQIAMVWNASGALYRLFLLAVIALLAWRRSVTLVALLLGVFDLMVAGCSVLYLIEPWPILPTDERCSARLNFPLGVLCAVVALALTVHIARGKR